MSVDDCQWIGLGEQFHRKTYENLIFHGKNHGFRLKFSRENQSIEFGAVSRSSHIARLNVAKDGT